MPIYEFECEVCGHRFDYLLRLTDPNPSCPQTVEEGSLVCGGATKKLISPSTFHLRGSGWAADGY